MSTNAQKYSENGVVISQSIIYVGDEVTLWYSGLLMSSGAFGVYAHVGYGDGWEEKAFIPMNIKDGVYSTNIKIILAGKLNITFKDTASNWDNNSSQNYVFEILEKADDIEVEMPGTAEGNEEEKSPKKAKARAKSSTKKNEV